MLEAVRTSETSVDNHFIRQYIPEDNSEHHTRRRENLKSHIDQMCKILNAFLGLSKLFTDSNHITDYPYLRQLNHSHVCIRCVTNLRSNKRWVG
jgi:hypothetical protein